MRCVESLGVGVGRAESLYIRSTENLYSVKGYSARRDKAKDHSTWKVN
jgi:hypothetical protein